MYGRIVLGIPGEEFEALSRRPRNRPGPRPMPGADELLRYLVDAYKQIVER